MVNGPYMREGYGIGMTRQVSFTPLPQYSEPTRTTDVEVPRAVPEGEANGEDEDSG